MQTEYSRTSVSGHSYSSPEIDDLFDTLTEAYNLRPEIERLTFDEAKAIIAEENSLVPVTIEISKATLNIWNKNAVSNNKSLSDWLCDKAGRYFFFSERRHG